MAVPRRPDRPHQSVTELAVKAVLVGIVLGYGVVIALGLDLWK